MIEATDGEDAVKKFVEHNGAVHLLVLDVIMPKKKGKRPMTKSGDYHSRVAPVSVKATNTILNPWYTLPVQGRAPIYPRRDDVGCDAFEITTPCRVELKEHDLRLFFQNNEIVFEFTCDSAAPPYFINPIRYFLIYKTFIDYSMIRPADTLPCKSAFDEVDAVRFKVRCLPPVETDNGLSHKTTDELIEVSMSALTQYLSVLDETLYYALAFYLSGCNYPQYFLINFSKVIEKIQSEFGSQKNFFQALKPYGVIEDKYDEFGKLCNDKKRNPLNISRHSPLPEAPLYPIDMQKLFVDPRSREVFTSAIEFCRQIIDAYMAFLVK